MRAAVLLFLVFLFCACSSAPQPVAPQAEYADAASLAARTVALVTVRGDGAHAYCSGVWVSSHMIATANHCLRDAKPGEVLEYSVRTDVYAPGAALQREDIPTHEAVIIATDEDHDLALLRAVAPPEHQVAPVSITPVFQGMRVQTMGHPLGLWFSYSSGDVAAFRVENDLTEPTLMIQSTAPISPGNSGGGLFDRAGNLLGICHAMYSRGQNTNLHIHFQYLAPLFKRACGVVACN